MTSSQATRVERLESWQTLHDELDYSWEGLANHPTFYPDHAAIRGKTDNPTLQAYWRSGLDGNPLRSNDQMLDELVESPTGELWHITHVPLYWKDGSPAKSAWNSDQLENLERVITKRLHHAKRAGEDGFPKWSNIAFLQGVVIMHDLYEDKLNVYCNGTLFNGRFGTRLLSEHSYFNGCIFNDDVNLNSLAAVGELHLVNSYYHGLVGCHGAKFRGKAWFNGSVFNSFVNFTETEFHGEINLPGLVAHDTVEFRRCKFVEAAVFSDGEFRGPLYIEESTFLKPATFTGLQLRDRFSCANSQFLDATFFTHNVWNRTATPRSFGMLGHERAFNNCRFSSTAVFAGTGFSEFSAFDNAVFEGKIHLNRTSDTEAKASFKNELKLARSSMFPETSLDALQGGCQTLRHAMEQMSDKNAEHLLHKFELIAKRYQNKTPLSEKIISHIYGVSSDYGSSIGRPLALLAGSILAFGIMYGLLVSVWAGVTPLQSPVSFSESGWRSVYEGITFSAGRAFPFGPWSLEKSDFQQILLGSGTSLRSLSLRSICTLQSILSGILIFLSALAIRRRFRIG